MHDDDDDAAANDEDGLKNETELDSIHDGRKEVTMAGAADGVIDDDDIQRGAADWARLEEEKAVIILFRNIIIMAIALWLLLLCLLLLVCVGKKRES